MAPDTSTGRAAAFVRFRSRNRSRCCAELKPRAERNQGSVSFMNRSRTPTAPNVIVFFARRASRSSSLRISEIVESRTTGLLSSGIVRVNAKPRQNLRKSLETTAPNFAPAFGSPVINPSLY